MAHIGTEAKDYGNPRIRAAKSRKLDALLPRGMAKGAKIGLMPSSEGYEIPYLRKKGVTRPNQLVLFDISRGRLQYCATLHRVISKPKGTLFFSSINNKARKVKDSAWIAAERGVRLRYMDFDACGNLASKTGIDADVTAILQSGLLERKARLAITFSYGREHTLNSAKLGLERIPKGTPDRIAKPIQERNKRKRIAYLQKLVARHTESSRMVYCEAYKGTMPMIHCVFAVTTKG